MENSCIGAMNHWPSRLTESADKSDALQTLRARGQVSGRRVSVWSACVFSAAFPKQAAIRWPGRFLESLGARFWFSTHAFATRAVLPSAGPEFRGSTQEYCSRKLRSGTETARA